MADSANSVLTSVAASGSAVYVAGHFTEIGSLSSTYMARWSLTPSPTPTFDTPVRTDGGFTVNVTNYDPSYTWTPTRSAGTVTAGTASGSTLPLTVTGLAAGASSTVTVTTSRSGYSNASASVTSQAKGAQTVTWSPTTSITTMQSPLTPSASASTTGNGAITYAKVSNTTTTCAVDVNTGALTYTGTGNCVVRATAAGTSSYLEGTSSEVTFTVSKATQTVTWSPTTSLTLPASSVTPTAATALGGVPIAYSKISNTTATCEVDSVSGAVTYSGTGDCVVRASAAATDDYEAGYTEVTFTVSKATPTLTWNPSTSLEVPDGSATFAAASTAGDGAITYAVTSAGTTGCSLPSPTSRTLSFTAEGSCQVTSTSASTSDYNQVTSVKTFAISKAAQTVTWSPSSALSLASLSETLTAATASGDGAITYAVTSDSGSGCAFADATQPVLTYTGAGSCSVTATAASTTGYAQGTQSAAITISLATPTLTWAPTTALTMPAATVTPTLATTSGDGTITYAVTSGSNCTVDTNTGAITYTSIGACQITASSSATARYAAGSSAVTFTVSLASQSITAAATSTSLRPRGTSTISESGSSGSGAITWTNTTLAICTLTGTSITADANGSCILTVTIAADSTYASASDSITITVSTPTPAGGGGSAGGSSGDGSSGSDVTSSATSSTAPSGGTAGGASGSSQSQDVADVPGTGATTRGRALTPPPVSVDVQPLRSGSRSAVLIKQPAGVSGAQVLATVVVVRDAKGKVISRVNIELEPGQTQTRVTIPYVADGYSVDVYNVNEVGVPAGALTRSPLVRASTITTRTESGQPRLFGRLLGEPITFNAGSSVLDTADKKQLRAIAQQAKTANERLFVTGFARKGVGTKNELASLSTKRAEAAAEYPSEQGVRAWIRYWGAGSLNGMGALSGRRVEVRTSAAPIPQTLVP